MSKGRNRDRQRQPVPQAAIPTTDVVRQIVRHEISAQAFSGPLPHPEILAKYNDAVPDGAERIIVMAEEQAKHRMALESRVVDADIKRANWGLAAGFLVAIAGLVASCIMVIAGNEWAGLGLGSLDLVGLAAVFVYGTVSRRNERQQRLKMMTNES